MWTTLSTSRIEEQYREYARNLIALWREYYPGYDEALRMLSEPERQDHLRRVYIAWSCEKLAWELAKAKQMRWPFRNPYWLEHMLSRGVPIHAIARATKAPRWLVRFYVWKYGLMPGASFRWVCTGRMRQEALPEQAKPAIAAQAAFSDWIFVLPQGSRIFIPAEVYLDSIQDAAAGIAR